MVGKHVFLILLALSVASFSPDPVAQVRKQWRPATADDVARQQTRTGAEALPLVRDAATGKPQPLGQQAYIDPLTNELVSGPSAASPALPTAAAAPAPDFTLQRTQDGFLYINTSEFRHIQTVTIGAGSMLSMECSVQSPWSKPTSEDPAATQ